MKLHFLFLAVAILVAACGQKGSDNGDVLSKEEVLAAHKGWEDINAGVISEDGTFYSEDGQFMIEFPGLPEHSADIVETELGKVQTHSYIHSPSLTEGYMVYYCDYPTDYVNSVDKRQMLFSALEGALKPIEAMGTQEMKEFTLNDDPAIEFMGQGETMYIAGRLYLIKNRLYQVSIVKDGSYPSEETRDKFLDSFYLVDIKR